MDGTERKTSNGIKVPKKGGTKSIDDPYIEEKEPEIHKSDRRITVIVHSSGTNRSIEGI